MIWCNIPSTYFPLAAYLVFSICGGAFFAARISSNARNWESQWKSFLKWFPYFAMYSLIGVSLTPLILKVVDNELFESVVGKESFRFYLLASYMMLTAIAGISVVKKLVGVSFGDDVAKDFEAEIENLKKTQVENIDAQLVKQQVSAPNNIDLTKSSIYELLEFINKNPRSDITSIDQKSKQALDFLVEKNLIDAASFAKGKLVVSRLGDLYLSSKV
jgi:hypothetical protein